MGGAPADYLDRTGKEYTAATLASARPAAPSGAHRHHHLGPNYRRAAERAPGVHHLAAPLEQVAPRVCLLRRIANPVGERHLGDLAREVRPRAAPVAERRAEAVHRRVHAHALEYAAQAGGAAVAREDERRPPAHLAHLLEDLQRAVA